jgi:hypothetical protein
MTDEANKGFDPISPLGEGEVERVLTDEEKAALKYPGVQYPTGRRFHNFPKSPNPNVIPKKESDIVVDFPNALERRIRRLSRGKGNRPGGAA